MARVTLTFEDAIGGPLDGARAGCMIEAEPALRIHGDGTPCPDTTTAQRMALVAIGAVSEHFEVGASTSDIRRVE